jgi:enoyl-CoA hydratase/carnithine racemase
MPLSFETLLYETDGHIATLTLNRPQALNALSQRMFAELPVAWQAFADDPEARVLIFTGAGDRALCAGVDVKEEASGGHMRQERTEAQAAPRYTARQCGIWKPVICAINGIVGGGGLMFVADADLVIAAEHAQIFNPGVSVGIVSPMGPVTLARKASFDAAMRMFLTGAKERLSAQRAHQLGLVGEVVPKEDLLPAARRLAEKIVANSPAAVAGAQRALWESFDHGLTAAVENSDHIIRPYLSHPDFTEGPRAFAEKRKPVWTVR